jgi:lipopolysaccharide transport system permease protein
MVMAEREFTSRFKSSVLGSLWAVLQPAAVVLLFYYVFAVIFGARWGTSKSSGAHYIVGMFSGLIVYNVFAETVGRSVACISGNPNYVTKIKFPVSILPIVQLVFSLMNFAVSFLVLLAFGLITSIVPLSTAMLAIPIALISVIAWSLGSAWIVSAANVYFRDTSVVVPLILQVLLFLSPVFYAAEQSNELVKSIIKLSPLSPPISAMRAIMIDGRFPVLDDVLVSSLAGVAFMLLGFVFFARARKGFADVI